MLSSEVTAMPIPLQELDFQELPVELASSPAPQNFKFERADWTSFRTVEGLQQKAGVAKSKLRRLVLKELTDNALDENAMVRIGELCNGGYFVEDHGRGIDGTPEEIAQLFSIARPMVSTKLLGSRPGVLLATACGSSPGQFLPRRARSSSSPAIARWCFGPSETARRRL